MKKSNYFLNIAILIFYPAVTLAVVGPGCVPTKYNITYGSRFGTKGFLDIFFILFGIFTGIMIVIALIDLINVKKIKDRTKKLLNYYLRYILFFFLYLTYYNIGRNCSSVFDMFR